MPATLKPDIAKSQNLKAEHKINHISIVSNYMNDLDISNSVDGEVLIENPSQAFLPKLQLKKSRVGNRFRRAEKKTPRAKKLDTAYRS